MTAARERRCGRFTETSPPLRYGPCAIGGGHAEFAQAMSECGGALRSLHVRSEPIPAFVQCKNELMSRASGTRPAMRD